MTKVACRVLAVASVTIAVLVAPIAASAHPLCNFTINLYSGIQLTPGEVRIDYVVDMAEIPTFQEMPNIDADGDGIASDAERAAWAGREAPQLLVGLSLSVDGRPVELRVLSSSMRFRPGQGGLPILRFEATFGGEVARVGSIAYRDDNFPGRIGWREIVAAGQDGVALRSSNVPTQSVSDALLSYPQDLLSSPLRVTSAAFSFAPGTSVSASGVRNEGAVSEGRPGVSGGAFADLVSRTGFPLIVLALLLAVAFGAVHALGPGHGKTLMAAYLVGAGGRVRQAVAVGGAVALMHTASVLSLGFVVFSAERVFAPERVYPWLGLLSGLVALGLGAGLLVVRLGAWGNARVVHAHAHDSGSALLPEHEHGSEHGHSHSVADAPLLSRRGLMALAIAGGILPSPTALVVLLASVAIHRVVFGLALIAAFSLGLAAALIVVGAIALRARVLVSKRLSTRAGRLMPVLSASAIVVVGLVLTVQGVTRL